MKITFTFTDSPELEGLSKDDIYITYLEIPDEAQHLIGYEQRIFAIAEGVGRLTRSALHMSCKEMGLKNHAVKTDVDVQPNSAALLSQSVTTFVFYLEHFGNGKLLHRQFKIYTPVSVPIPEWFFSNSRKSRRDQKSLRLNLFQLNFLKPTTDGEGALTQSIGTVIDQLLMLLNAGPANGVSGTWSCAGFHPLWVDSALINRNNKRVKRRMAEEKKRQREEEKQKARKAKKALQPASSTASPPVKTGAGRRPGAIPGVFKGVQFRSQLEIRFATELESRGIRWEYEIERLGEGQYLVDFFLPDCACWVEVKGRFEPRDDYLLKEVAGRLLQERGQKLFVYMQSKCYEVQETAFQEMKREDFWTKLLSLPRHE